MAVAPQLISMEKRWEMMAWERWRERLPREIVRRGTYLKFSSTVNGY